MWFPSALIIHFGGCDSGLLAFHTIIKNKSFWTNKLTKTKPSDEIFTQEEKNVVTDFLKSIKNELKIKH